MSDLIERRALSGEVETPDDLLVRRCAEFARRVILSDKRRSREDLAALVFNSLMHMRSRPNTAKE